MNRLVNARTLPTGWRTDPKYLYIGRPSFLQNPFRMGTYQSRVAVIEKFREYLPQLRERDPNTFDTYMEFILKSEVTLVCWCVPELCHGQVILEYLEEIRKQQALPKTWQQELAEAVEADPAMKVYNLADMEGGKIEF